MLTPCPQTATSMAVCLDDLVLKHAFTDSAARNFLRVYDATIAFAGLTDADTVTEPAVEVDAEDTPPASEIKVGDLVHIEIDGVRPVEGPKRVRAIQKHDGQDWVFIEGSETGFEMNQVLLHESAPSTPAKAAPRLALETPAPPASTPNVVPEGWSEETLIDDDGSEIKIRYLGKASLERYQFIHDYLDFKINRLKPKVVASALTPTAEQAKNGVPE